MNLRKDHYRNTVEARTQSQTLFRTMLPSPVRKMGVSAGHSGRGGFRIPKTASFTASWGTCSPRLGERELGLRTLVRCLFATVQRAALPPHDASFPNTRNPQTSTKPGKKGRERPPSDGQRELVVAATRRPVKTKVKAQLLAVDHSARVSMKSAASCVN